MTDLNHRRRRACSSFEVASDNHTDFFADKTHITVKHGPCPKVWIGRVSYSRQGRLIERSQYQQHAGINTRPIGLRTTSPRHAESFKG